MVVIGPHYRDEEVAHRVAEPSRPERQKRAEGREFRGPQFQHQHSYENGEHPVRESVQPLWSPPRIWHGPPFSPVLFRYRFGQLNVFIQPAMARPISSGESSWTKWTPLTVTSVCAGKLRACSRTLPSARIPPGSALRNSLGTLLVFSQWA